MKKLLNKIFEKINISFKETFISNISYSEKVQDYFYPNILKL